MGRSKERYTEQLYREHGEEIADKARVDDELHQNYYVSMARKYFPDGCNICNSKRVILTDSSVIYGKSYGNIYLCLNCGAYVGVHEVAKNPHGEINAPKGTLGDRELRELRKIAHGLFDPIWKRKILSRGGAYKMLMRILDIPKERAHIAMLTKEELNKLILELRNREKNEHKPDQRKKKKD